MAEAAWAASIFAPLLEQFHGDSSVRGKRMFSALCNAVRLYMEDIPEY